MIEDKLTQAQRIRLESVAQANLVMHGCSVDERVEGAKKFEKYILGEEASSGEEG